MKMINQIKCLGCWQTKTFNQLNQHYFCESCQEKYDNFFINAIPRCDACKAFIKKKRIENQMTYTVYPEPIPEVRIGLVLANYLQNLIKEKGGQQKVEGWFYFCRDCDKELDNKRQQNTHFEEWIIGFGKEKYRLTSILELAEQKQAKLNI